MFLMFLLFLQANACLWDNNWIIIAITTELLLPRSWLKLLHTIRYNLLKYFEWFAKMARDESRRRLEEAGRRK